MISLDVAGRGKSDWLTDSTSYSYPQYVADATALISYVLEDSTENVHWVGTSMGGLIVSATSGIGL